MNFNDEFEYVCDDGTYYSVEVAGVAIGDECEVNEVRVFDCLGNEVDDSNEHYENVVEHAKNREVNIEIDETNFNWCNDHIDNFLRE